MGFNFQKWLGDEETFRFLVARGFRIMDDLDQTQRDETLRGIFKKNNLKFVKNLIENGLDTTNYNPLLLAIESLQIDDLRIIKCLVQNGCSVNVPEDDSSGSWDTKPTPLTAAIRNNFPKISEYLLQHGTIVGKKDLEFVGRSHNLTFIDILRSFGIDLNQHGAIVLRGALDTDRKVTGRSLGITKNQISMVEALLQAGVNPNAKDEYNSTCGHHFAATCSYFVTYKPEKEQIMKMLLNNGLDVNAVDCLQENALHVTPHLHTEMLEILLKNGANSNIRNRNGKTMHHFTLSTLLDQGDITLYHEAIQIFNSYGADFNIAGTHGKTLLADLIDRKYCCCYGFHPFRSLLDSVEVGLSVDKECEKLCGHYKCVLPLVQAGCNNADVLRHMSYHLTTADYDQLIACVFPVIRNAVTIPNDLMGKTTNVPNPVMYSGMHRLEYLAIHAIRKQILTANGNKSLIPRARKLPLPPPLVDMVTLGRYWDIDVKPDKPHESSSDSDDYSARSSDSE